MSDTPRTVSHAQALQAIGLLSTLAPKVRLNPDDLLGTAQAIVAHVKAQGLPVEPRLKPLADNAELLERLRERTESHLAASARDVATIQRQAVELDAKTAEIEAMRVAISQAIPCLDTDCDLTDEEIHGTHPKLIARRAALRKLQPFIKP